jgi:hypothetical protein
MLIRTCILLTAALFVAEGCNGSGEPATAPTPLKITATENHLDLAGTRTVPAGLVHVTFRNRGRDPHALGIWRLNDGVTFERFRRRANGDGAIDLVSPRGGVAQLDPGRTWEMTTQLRPGLYGVVDYAGDDPGQKSNMERGMIASLRVTPAQHRAEAPPQAAVSVTLDDFAFRGLPTTFSTDAVLDVRSRGHEGHEVNLIRLAPDKTMADVRSALKQFLAGNDVEPPGEVVELLGPVATGWRGWIKPHLAPGRYAALCLMPDSATGKVHAELGMVSSFTVTRD